MITLTDLSLRAGTRLLLEKASVTLFAGQKVGIIGRNGMGKTSLFRLFMGEMSADAGEISIPGHLRKSWMKQETEGSDKSALDHVLDGHAQFRQLEAELSKAESGSDDNALARVLGELDSIGSYSLSNQAEQLLSGLGFSVEEFAKSVGAFSGGWRIRLNLAQALMSPSDILLLDEPTNHLDLEATLWLQQWLQTYPGTLLLISHDREFLDSITSHILSLENQSLILSKGNYTAYEIQKAERLSQQQAAYEKQQERISEIDNFVRRFRAKATKARQAQSRLKELERMERIAPAHIDSPFTFKFRKPDKLPESLLALSGLSIGYEAPLASGIDLNLRKDSRIGLLGANGQGKSTLLKVLAEQLQPLGGKIDRHEYLNVGYLAQHHIDTLDLKATPMQMLTRLDSAIREQDAKNFLGSFDFRGGRIDETIEHFSGGEKARLALSLLVWQKPNLLLLDEPTNHLDLEMRYALTVALQSFEGAIMLVSHDRHLLGNAVDQFMLVKDGEVTVFEGDLADYEAMLKNPDTPVELSSSHSKNENVVDKKALRQQAAERRENRKSFTRRLKQVDKRLAIVQKRSAEIEALLSKDEMYDPANQSELQTLLLEKGELQKEMDALESEWLELSEILELQD